jgi:hypothetical protein
MFQVGNSNQILAGVQFNEFSHCSQRRGGGTPAHFYFLTHVLRRKSRLRQTVHQKVILETVKIPMKYFILLMIYFEIK